MQRIDGKKMEKMTPPALFTQIVLSLDSGKPTPDAVAEQILQDTLLGSIRYWNENSFECNYSLFMSHCWCSLFEIEHVQIKQYECRRKISSHAGTNCFLAAVGFLRLKLGGSVCCCCSRDGNAMDCIVMRLLDEEVVFDEGFAVRISSKANWGSKT